MVVFRFFTFALVAATFLLPAYAQSPQTQLKGKVLDPTRAAIAGAQVEAVPDGASAGLSTVSNDTGEFLLLLGPGKYTVKVVATGFAETVQSVDVDMTDPQSHEFILHVAGVQTNVIVTETVGYHVPAISSATKTLTPLLDVPQSIAVVTQKQVRDQLMLSVGDTIRYIPGIGPHQGENNRDQVIIRGNNSSADFFVNGVRDDVQYYRDLYNLERVEALKGPNAMIFGRGGGGGVINRVSKEAVFVPLREVTLLGGSYASKRFSTDLDHPFTTRTAFRMNGMYENSDSFRNQVNLERYGINPTMTFASGGNTKLTVGYEHFRDGRVADRGIPSFQGRPADTDVATYFGDPDSSDVRAHVNVMSATIEHQSSRLNVQNRTSFGDYDRFYQNFVPGTVDAGKTFVALSAY